MIEIKNLTVKGILKNINLNIKSGEITTIVGANGSGKTTLVKAICSLISYDGNIESSEKKTLVFQNPDVQFVRSSVIDDMAFGLENLNLPKDKMDELINKLSRTFNIEDIIDEEISNLSGGQKQVIAILDNLILSPDILILDEAFEMLDFEKKEALNKFIIQYVKEKNIVCINISHDEDIVPYSDRIIGLKDKSILFDCNVDDFYENDNLLNDLGFKKPIYKKINKNMKSFNELEEFLCSLD